MMNAAIRVVADYGIGGFTTKKWAAEAGVAEGSLYYHFKSKNDLLDQTFLYVNHQIASALAVDESKLADQETLKKTADNIWRTAYRYLIENAEYTKYFCRYRTSTRYSQEIRNYLREEYTSLMNTMKQIHRYHEFREDVDWDFFWGYLVDATTSMALRVIDKNITDTEAAENMFIRLMMEGLVGVFKVKK